MSTRETDRIGLYVAAMYVAAMFVAFAIAICLSALFGVPHKTVHSSTEGINGTSDYWNDSAWRQGEGLDHGLHRHRAGARALPLWVRPIPDHAGQAEGGRGATRLVLVRRAAHSAGREARACNAGAAQRWAADERSARPFLENSTPVAHLGERLIPNHQVAGSTPAWRATGTAPAARCEGRGRVALPAALQETLTLLRKRGSLTPIELWIQLHMAFGGATAANNRLETLRRLGFAARARINGKTWKYSAVKP